MLYLHGTYLWLGKEISPYMFLKNSKNLRHKKVISQLHHLDLVGRGTWTNYSWEQWPRVSSSVSLTKPRWAPLQAFSRSTNWHVNKNCKAIYHPHVLCHSNSETRHYYVSQFKKKRVRDSWQNVPCTVQSEKTNTGFFYGKLDECTLKVYILYMKTNSRY